MGKIFSCFGLIEDSYLSYKKTDCQYDDAVSNVTHHNIEDARKTIYKRKYISSDAISKNIYSTPINTLEEIDIHTKTDRHILDILDDIDDDQYVLDMLDTINYDEKNIDPDNVYSDWQDVDTYGETDIDENDPIIICKY